MSKKSFISNSCPKAKNLCKFRWPKGLGAQIRSSRGKGAKNCTRGQTEHKLHGSTGRRLGHLCVNTDHSRGTSNAAILGHRSANITCHKVALRRPKKLATLFSSNHCFTDFHVEHTPILRYRPFF